MKLTGAAILVLRVMKVLKAAPAAYPYRSTAEAKGMNNVPAKVDESGGPTDADGHHSRMGGSRRLLLAVGVVVMSFIAVDNAIDAGAAADPVGWWFWVRKVGLPGLFAAMFLVQALRGR
jgi:hypothetical protein